jgi:hypothetical protein
MSDMFLRTTICRLICGWRVGWGSEGDILLIRINGDEYPITGLGKLLTACISILGIGMFALPAGILASGFSDEFKKMKQDKCTCPNCGSEL